MEDKRPVICYMAQMSDSSPWFTWESELRTLHITSIDVERRDAVGDVILTGYHASHAIGGYSHSGGKLSEFSMTRASKLDVFTLTERAKKPETFYAGMYGVSAATGSYRKMSDFCNAITALRDAMWRRLGKQTTHHRFVKQDIWWMTEQYDAILKEIWLSSSIDNAMRLIGSANMALRCK